MAEILREQIEQPNDDLPSADEILTGFKVLEQDFPDVEELFDR